MNKFKRLAKFLADRRQIYFAPWQWGRLSGNFSAAGSKEKKIDQPIFFALTVDLEQDYGSLGDGSKDCLKPFFDIFKTVIKNRKATFFVQGDLIGDFLKEIKKLQDEGHELGLHGFHHELWGEEQWSLPDRYVAVEKRRELLEASLKVFQDAGLTRPFSFRAPNLVIDEETYGLLEEYGFLFDSSAAVFMGVYPLPYYKRQVAVVPPTSDITVDILWKGILPYFNFRMFDLYHLLAMNDEELAGFVERVVDFQIERKIRPHLVFFCHPWEFSESDERYPLSSYCSPDNAEILHSKLSFLEKRFGLKYLRFDEVCKMVASL